MRVKEEVIDDAGGKPRAPWPPPLDVIWLCLAHEFNRMPPTSLFDSNFVFVLQTLDLRLE